jgi:hypothetical protein
MSWRGWTIPECPGEAGQYLNALERLGYLNVLERLGSTWMIWREAYQYLNALERLGST